MGTLIVRPLRHQTIALPHYLLLNGTMLGLMRAQTINISLPPGTYRATIRSAYKFIESSITLTISDDKAITLQYGDRERWWNWLFNLYMVIWLVKRFIHIPEPYSTIYEVLSNGFFAVWLLRIWIIRKHYFKLVVS